MIKFKIYVIWTRIYENGFVKLFSTFLKKEIIVVVLNMAAAKTYLNVKLGVFSV